MRVAVIGSGISGLMSAYLLQRQHEVHVFEAGSHIGGHTNTIPVHRGGRTWNVDTGFIVFNELNYPMFTRLLTEIGVESRASTMSFSVADPKTGIEYNGHTLNTLFAQRRNILRPQYWGFIRDIMRFNKLATQFHQNGDDSTLGAFLAKHQFGTWFIDLYIIPMTGAIWSMGNQAMMHFPMKTLAAFMHNHRMLQAGDRPQWRTVVGGSSQYIAPLTKQYRDRIRINTPVSELKRDEDGVRFQAGGEEQHFDAVVLACHSTQSLAILADPSADEERILGAMPYSANRAVLHTDTSRLPKKKLAHAAWNAHPGQVADERSALTYHMNILQGLRSPETFLVSLGQEQYIDSAHIIKSIAYEHPCFSCEFTKAQAEFTTISGQQHTYYAGAYWGYGFHEDGVSSAVRMAEQWGITW